MPGMWEEQECCGCGIASAQVRWWIFYALPCILFLSFPGVSEGKAPACNTEDPGSILALGSSPGEGNGNPLQNSCLEKPMDGLAWWATVHEV